MEKIRSLTQRKLSSVAQQPFGDSAGEDAVLNKLGYEQGEWLRQS